MRPYFFDIISSISGIFIDMSSEEAISGTRHKAARTVTDSFKYSSRLSAPLLLMVPFPIPYHTHTHTGTILEFQHLRLVYKKIKWIEFLESWVFHNFKPKESELHSTNSTIAFWLRLSCIF